MDIKYQLEISKFIQDKAQNIALRWVKAWDKSSYGSVGDVKIDFDNQLIRFFAKPYTSGYSWAQSISINYLLNDSTLEQDASIWYQKYQENRLKELEEKRFLENSPDVQKWKNLNSPTLNHYTYLP